MIPQPNQKVQVRFVNGIFFDAIVESWSDEKTVLKLAQSEDKIIIQDTKRDVLLVRLINEVKKPVSERVAEIEKEFEAEREKPRTKDNIKSLAELKVELIKAEREEIANKTKTFDTEGVREIKYGLPIGGFKKHTTQETATKDFSGYRGLQGLFEKKHKNT